MDDIYMHLFYTENIELLVLCDWVVSGCGLFLIFYLTTKIILYWLWMWEIYLQGKTQSFCLFVFFF